MSLLHSLLKELDRYCCVEISVPILKQPLVFLATECQGSWSTLLDALRLRCVCIAKGYVA